MLSRSDVIMLVLIGCLLGSVALASLAERLFGTTDLLLLLALLLHLDG